MQSEWLDDLHKVKELTKIPEFRLMDRFLSPCSTRTCPSRLSLPYQCNSKTVVNSYYKIIKKFCLPRSSVAKGSKFEDTDRILALSASFCSLILCVSLSKFFS